MEETSAYLTGSEKNVFVSAVLEAASTAEACKFRSSIVRAPGHDLPGVIPRWFNGADKIERLTVLSRLLERAIGGVTEPPSGI